MELQFTREDGTKESPIKIINSEDLKAYLEALVRLTRQQQPKPGFVYATQYHFLLAHGKPYPIKPYPPDFPRFNTPSRCYFNSFRAVRRRATLRYVEGCARTSYGFIIDSHAWVTDGEYAYDPTWIDEPGTAYWGIEFSAKRVYDVMKNGTGSVLDDWKRGWPLYQEEWKDEDWS